MPIGCGEGTSRYWDGGATFARCDKSHLQTQERLSRLLDRAESHSNHIRVRSSLSRNRRHVGDLHVELLTVAHVQDVCAPPLQVGHVLHCFTDGCNLATVHQRQNPYTLVVAASGGGATKSPTGRSDKVACKQCVAILSTASMSDWILMDSDVAATQPVWGR